MMRVIANDQNMRSADIAVANVLLASLDPGRGDAQISHPEICRRTGLSLGKVRGALRRLAAGGYFAVIEPSGRDLYYGDHARRYRPQLEV
ncbi:DNA-binding GntR family transcriptional regulator [Bradyrhizobium ottawaense]|uniref:winged helix-turn-helix domain-containing protein n=1 Tax=Bradyrhizobium ottawaense TaxID=931866 RepID=UPI003837E970